MRTSDRMIEGLRMDNFPESGAAWADFGLNAANVQGVFGALQYGLQRKLFDEEAIHAASCSGPKITALVARAVAAGCAYGRGLTVRTIWDDMPGEAPDGQTQGGR